MKRKFIFLLLIFCIGLTECYASSVNLYSNSTTITKGNSVKVSVTVNTDYPMVSIEGTLKCSGVVNSSYDLTYDDSSNSLKSKTYTYNLTPTTSGNITCNLQNVRVTHLGSASWETLASSSLNITVNNPPVVAPKPKSTNSFLSSLTVDGYELNTKFDKELLEYSVTVKEGTEKIKVNAQLADSTASVIGVGEIAVTEGINTVNIVVTAENGSKRTYTLKVNVKEYEPINVTIENEKYTVVRHRKNLPKISDYFKEAEITIDKNTIEGYHNENLNYHVVGLKDTKGNISYYIYKDGKYSLYNEQVFNGKVLRILDKELTGGYQKTNFKYNNTDIKAYQEVKMDIIKNTYALDNNDIEGNDFYLFYAINLDTGKEELYQYDAKEKTVQRYNTLILDMYKEQKDTYYLYLLCSFLVLGVAIVTFSTIIMSGSKKKKKLKNKRYEEIRKEVEEELKNTNNKNNSKKKRKKSIEKELELD